MSHAARTPVGLRAGVSLAVVTLLLASLFAAMAACGGEQKPPLTPEDIQQEDAGPG